MSGRRSRDSEDSDAPLDPDQLLNYVQDVTGWNTYHAAAYVTLVRAGPLEASDIVAMTNIPKGRVYDILEELEGTAIDVQHGNPKRYRAQHPRSVLGDKQDSFNQKANQATNHLEQQHEINRERQDPQHPAWVIPGIAGTKRRIREGLDAAEERILLMEEDGNWIQDNQIRDLRQIASNGVEVRVVGWRRWRGKLTELADAGVRAWEHDQVESSFCIIDDDLVVLRVGRGDTGVMIEDEGAVNVLQKAFEASRKEATEIQPDE